MVVMPCCRAEGEDPLNAVIRKWWLPLIVLLTLLPWHALQAHPKTDRITLYNGDRITGEIKSMTEGQLELSTDAMNTIHIEWQEIARIESKYNYQIRLSNGQRYYGEIGSGERPGDITIRDIDGVHNVEYLQIVEMQPIEDDLWDRFDAYLSAGYDYTKASSVAQITFNTNLSYEDQHTRSALDARTTITNTQDDDSQSSQVQLTRQVWAADRSEYFRGLYGNYESNDELGVDYRVSAGAGIGRYFVDTYRKRLVGGAGLQVLTERGEEGGKQESVEAFFAGEYAVWRFHDPEMDISLGASLYPSITESGRLRGSTDLRIRWEIINDLYWDVTAYGSYDNQADSDNDSDYGISTSLGWSY